MSQFGSNLPFSNFPFFKNLGNLAKQALDKLNPNLNKQQSKIQNIQQNQGPTNTQTNPNKSLANTNSNINLNPSTQADPAITQHTLNAHNKSITQETNTNVKDLPQNKEVQTAPNKADSQGAKDLPNYAGISNMSLKSWVAGRESKSSPKSEFKEKELASTLEGIKGFQNRNQDGFGGDTGDQGQSGKKRNLFILSHIFANYFNEKSGNQETELLVNIGSFKKLGSRPDSKDAMRNEDIESVRLAPPAPEDLQSFESLDYSKVRYLHQLLALPKEFPEGIRLFAKESLEINPNELRNFLEHRFVLVQEQLLGGEPALNNIVSGFVPLLNQADFPVLLPFLLLYYPLPVPSIRDDIDFIKEWKKGKSKTEKEEVIVASCQVYYVSKYLGRILLKFLLTQDNKFSFDIETSEKNEYVVRSLEEGIEEIMFLLEYPPTLSELNVMLTREIYEATDADEELAIDSKGSMRIEILLAVYSSLMVLNRLNIEPDASGIIEMEIL